MSTLDPADRPHHGSLSSDGGVVAAPGEVFTPLPKFSTRADDIIRILRESISQGTLIPGSLHSVQKLAAQLGVSRTPVREALLSLAKEGFVRFERNRGVRILEHSEQEVLDIFELREWLEVPAVRLAARHASEQDLALIREALTRMQEAVTVGDISRMWREDESFHRALLNASGNGRAIQLVSDLRARALHAHHTSIGRGREPEDVVAAHQAIYDAVDKRLPDQAARLIRDYLRQTGELITGTTRRRDRPLS